MPSGADTGTAARSNSAKPDTAATVNSQAGVETSAGGSGQDLESTAQTGPELEADTAAGAPSREATASLDIGTQQQTQVREVFTEVDSEPVEPDIDLNVGARVPGTATFHPRPRRIVEFVPAYDGDEYFVLADGRIVFVEPATPDVVQIVMI